MLLRSNPPAPAPVERPHRRGSCATSWLFLIAAGVSIALGFGYTVDDALISARVAHHLRTTGHYIFNAGGPATDCVTPLGWSFVLAPWSRTGPWAGLNAARLLGALCTLASALLLARLVLETKPDGSLEQGSRQDAARAGTNPRLLSTAIVVVALATHLPVGAWATSGMETSCVLLLCTGATFGMVRRRRFGPLCAGIAAAWRPELVPWAVTFTLFSPLPTYGHSARPYTGRGPSAVASSRLLRVGLVLLPVGLVVATRLLCFGSPFPLAVSAKPSDSAHGLSYAWGALRFMAFPALMVGVKAWRGVPPTALAAAVALGAHFVTVIGVGGDWMSLFRLFVPLAPTGLWVGWHVLLRQPPWVIWTKGVFTVGINLLLLQQLGPEARGVTSARADVIGKTAPLLRRSTHVATLDVGWVGAATSMTITDLAGVTDPEIARLPGGHTSKRLPSNLLERRRIDALVVLLAPGEPPPAVGTPLAELRPARIVERELVRQYEADLFTALGSVPLQGTSQQYVVLTRRPRIEN